MPLMIKPCHTPANELKQSRAVDVWRETLVEVARRGFYGTAGIEISVQDGTIQTIRRIVDQIER